MYRIDFRTHWPTVAPSVRILVDKIVPREFEIPNSSSDSGRAPLAFCFGSMGKRNKPPWGARHPTVTCPVRAALTTAGRLTIYATKISVSAIYEFTDFR